MSLTGFVSDAELVGRSEERGSRIERRGFGFEAFFSLLDPRSSFLNYGFVEAGGVDATHWPWGAAVSGVDNPGPLGFRQVGTDCECAAAVLFDFVRAEDGERVFSVGVDNGGD
jgi:hypothetical protein